MSSSIVTKLEAPPKAPDDEMVIVRDVPAFIGKLKTSRLYVPAMVALFTGMRRSEVLALRWGRVDLDRKVIQVREALEPPRRRPLQDTEDQSRPARYHPARHSG